MSNIDNDDDDDDVGYFFSVMKKILINYFFLVVVPMVHTNKNFIFMGHIHNNGNFYGCLTGL